MGREGGWIWGELEEGWVVDDKNALFDILRDT